MSDLFGHLGFTLCLIFFSVLGGKTAATEMVFSPLAVLLKQSAFGSHIDALFRLTSRLATRSSMGSSGLLEYSKLLNYRPAV